MRPTDETLTDISVGLTSAEAIARLQTYGYNEVEEKKVWWGWKILARYCGVVQVIMVIAAILSITVETTCDKGDKQLSESCECSADIDIISFALLLFELNLVVWVDFFGERRSDDAMASLKALSSTSANVKRDGSWVKVTKRELVPGDIVGLTIGSTVPADGVLVGEGPRERHAPLKLDCAAVTGEYFATRFEHRK